MREFLITLSGARQEILKRCPTERLKFEGLGSVILITSGMAAVSMWFALYSAMGFNPILSLPIALMWGLIIMGIDRWLVTSMPTDGSRRWTIAIPRIFMALLLGSLISTPLVLRIFQSEINAQISVIKSDRYSAFVQQEQKSGLGQQITYWRNDVANLQRVIDSGGQVAINPSSDPVVKSLTTQRTNEITLEQRYYTQWQCQLYGGSGCPAKGNGPLAQADHQRYQQAVNEVTSLTGQIQARENALSATDAASKRVRYTQATSALPNAQQHLGALTNEQTALQQNFYAQNANANGLLIRLQALNQLSGKDFTINAARILLFLLFLLIECLPVTVKLMQQPGPYEKILAEAKATEEKLGRRAVRNTVPGSPFVAGRDVGGPAGGAASDPSPVGPDLTGIWRPEERTRVMTRRMPMSRTTDPMREEQPTPPEHTSPEDMALRDMEDPRTVVDIDGRGRGIELRYGDDDL